MNAVCVVQALIEQYAALHLRHEQLQKEAGRLRRLPAELRVLTEQHAVALELLGEKEEEVQTLRENQGGGE